MSLRQASLSLRSILREANVHVVGNRTPARQALQGLKVPRMTLEQEVGNLFSRGGAKSITAKGAKRYREARKVPGGTIATFGDYYLSFTTAGNNLNTSCYHDRFLIPFLMSGARRPE